MTGDTTLARAIARALAARGVRRMFGVPGGGSSLDLIDAGAREGIEFVLCRTETAAAIMAAVTGELTGVPGVVLTGIGPGAASVVNGVAYASVERAPLLVFTDTHEDGAIAPPHQIFDQQAMFAPISKAQLRLSPASGAAEIERLLDLATAEPPGPVHVDLSARDAAAPVPEPGPALPGAAAQTAAAGPDPALAEAARLLGNAARPAMVVGLQARTADRAAAADALAAALGGPVMTCYKARGVVADDHPLFVGTYTGAASDAAVLSRADLILFCGVDPVEMIPGRWAFDAPVVVLSESSGLAWPFAPAAEIVGPVAVSAAALADRTAPDRSWTPAEIRELRSGLAQTGALAGNGHTAQGVIEALAHAAPDRARLAVDAGAHMFSAMTRWPARAPHDVLKSNGLSTMGYAVPAALAGWLHEPGRPALAVTGDGGMMMCLAELSTAARLGADLKVVVLNDAALSLIDIKQQRQQRPPLGVRYPRVDFAGAARALGCAAWTVGRHAPLDAALAAALSHDGPALLDIAVDPSGYRDQLAALRG